MPAQRKEEDGGKERMEGGREERGLLGNKATFKIDGPRTTTWGTSLQARGDCV